METEESRRLRWRLAMALRQADDDNDFKIAQALSANGEVCLTKKLFVQKHKTGNWYYAEDSLDKPIMINFVNQCNSTECHQNFEGIDIPPEQHNFCGTYMSITIDNESPNVYMRILDRYSCLALDITEIKKKFQTNQEVIQMDNNVNNDAVAARRRALAEALRTGEPVVVTASGEVEKKDDAVDQGLSGIQVPDGKLA